MHPVAFARAFRAAYHVAPAELARALRIDWTAEQLRRPDRSTTSLSATFTATCCDL
jgi:methylphosphotriester-DNA--protein-cysteine methyltransferase